MSGNRLQVQQAANPADGLGVVKVVIIIAIAALAIIGLANLLTATAVGIGDHLHEAEVLAAIGLTPRQVMAHPGRQHHHPDRLRRRRSAPPRAWRWHRSWSTPRARPAASAGASPSCRRWP